MVCPCLQHWGAPLSLSLITYYAFCSFLKLCVNFNVFFILAWEKLSTFYPFKPKEANILFLGQDMIYKQSVILSLSDLVLLSLSFAFFFFFLAQEMRYLSL